MPNKILLNKLNIGFSQQISIAETGDKFLRDFELCGNSDCPHSDKADPPVPVFGLSSCRKCVGSTSFMFTTSKKPVKNAIKWITVSSPRETSMIVKSTTEGWFPVLLLIFGNINVFFYFTRNRLAKEKNLAPEPGEEAWKRETDLGRQDALLSPHITYLKLWPWFGNKCDTLALRLRIVGTQGIADWRFKTQLHAQQTQVIPPWRSDEPWVLESEEMSSHSNLHHKSPTECSAFLVSSAVGQVLFPNSAQKQQQNFKKYFPSSQCTKTCITKRNQLEINRFEQGGDHCGFMVCFRFGSIHESRVGKVGQPKANVLAIHVISAHPICLPRQKRFLLYHGKGRYFLLRWSAFCIKQIHLWRACQVSFVRDFPFQSSHLCSTKRNQSQESIARRGAGANVFPRLLSVGTADGHCGHNGRYLFPWLSTFNLWTCFSLLSKQICWQLLQITSAPAGKEIWCLCFQELFYFRITLSLWNINMFLCAETMWAG